MQKSKYKKNKHFFKYVRVDLKTIQGRFTVGFLIIFALALILLFVTNYQWSKIVENRQYVLKKLRPVNIYSSKTLVKIKETQVIFEKSLLFENDKDAYLSEFDEKWLSEVKSNRDSLKRKVKALSNNTITVLFSKFDNQVNNLRREYSQSKELYNTNLSGIKNINRTLRNYQQSTVIPLINIIDKNVKELEQASAKIEAEYDDEYKTLQFWRVWITAFIFLLLSIIFIVIVSLLMMHTLKKIRSLRNSLNTLALGNIPKIIPETDDEFNTLVKAINKLSVNLQVIKDFSQDVGNGRFDTQVSVFNNAGELGSSLSNMRESLQGVYDEDRRRTWANEGLAKFANILRNNNDDIRLLSQDVISNLVQYLKINQGGIFLEETKDDKVFLELKGMYAFDKQKLNKKKILPGEGVIGQAFLEGGLIHLKKIPEGYAEITSGLGQSNLQSLIIVPLSYNGKIIGMMELGSFNQFQPHEIAFVDNLSEVIASTILGVTSNEHTKILLQETRIKSENIRQKEEELRINTEELLATKENLEKDLKEAIKQSNKLSTIIDTINKAIIVYDQTGLIQYVDKDTALFFGYSQKDMFGLNVKVLFVLEESFRTTGNELPISFKDTLMMDEAREVKGIRKDGDKIELKMHLSKMDWNRKILYVATFPTFTL